jgi:hypothetical protein
VNGICGYGSSARCCQAAVAGSVIYADLRSKLSTHLAPQALFTQSSPVLGEMTLHPLSQACVFVYSSCGKWVFPPLLWSFPPTATFTSFPAPDYWVMLLLLPATVFVYSSSGKSGSSTLSCGVFLPLPLSQAFPLLVAGHTPLVPPEHLQPTQIVYLQFREGFPSPIFSAQCTPPSFPGVFIVRFAYNSVSLLSPGGGRSVQGAMLIWPRAVCGSTAKLTLSASSQAFWVRATGGPGALLVSPLT